MSGTNALAYFNATEIKKSFTALTPVRRRRRRKLKKTREKNIYLSPPQSGKLPLHLRTYSQKRDWSFRQLAQSYFLL